LSCSEEPSCARFDDVLTPAAVTNPDGLPYPSTDIGLRPASASRPGQHAPNFAFHGYLGARLDADLSLISLADFYDPSGKRNRLLHLMMAAMWCPKSILQTDEMARVVPSLHAEGLVVVQVLIHGPSRNAEPSTCDIERWIQAHQIGHTVAIDAGGQRLSQHMTITGVPWNALIDTRTMEVIDAGVGAPVDYEQTVRHALRWLDEHPVLP
jgi:hypothetical protein